MRFYDSAGRVAEICYQIYNPDLGLPTDDRDPRWLQVMLALTLKGDGMRSRLIERTISPAEREAIQGIWLRLTDRRKVAPDGAGWKDDLAAALDATLTPDTPLSLRATVERAFNAIADFTDLYPSFQKEIIRLIRESPKATALRDVQAMVSRLVDFGVVIQEASSMILPVKAEDQMSDAERCYMRGLNLALLSEVLFPEALTRSNAPAMVDLRLTTPKPWRDVYRYDPKSGKLLGWTRHRFARVAAFDAQGRLLPEGFKHPEITREVMYQKTAEGLLEWVEK